MNADNEPAVCFDCRRHEQRVQQLEAENERLKAALQRESWQWDQRATNSGKGR
jgi:hypothetical protein